MKKKIFYIIAVVLSATLLLSFSSCNMIKQFQDKEAGTDEITLDAIKSRGVLRVGVRRDSSLSPHVIYNDDGTVDGFDITLASKVAEDLGVSVEFYEMETTTEVPEALNLGNIDCYWCAYTITEERTAEVSFSIPYLDCDPIFVAKNNAKSSKFDINQSMKVAYRENSSIQTCVQSPSNAYLRRRFTFEALKSNDELFSALRTEKIDAIIIDETVANYMQRQDPSIAIPTEVDETTGEKKPISIADAQMGVAFCRKSVELKDYVNLELYSFAKTGYLQDLSIAYFGEDLSAVKY